MRNVAHPQFSDKLQCHNILLTFFFLLALPINSYSQDLPERLIENQINTSQSAEDNIEVDANEITETLSALEDNPIDINKMSEDELKATNVFNEFQILNIITYRKKYGYILTIYELYNINGFDKVFIDLIKPYIIIQSLDIKHKFSIDTILNQSKNQIYVRTNFTVEPQIGYSSASDSLKNINKAYLGSPYKLYTRYRFKYSKNISFGITTEKDAGEELFKGTQKSGFDFYSLHLYIANSGNIKALALGDYQLSFGQGLTLGTTGTFNRGLSIFNIKKFQTGIRPSISSNENKYFRGAGATMVFGKFEITTFISRKKIDANMQTDTLSKEEYASALQETGYHNTEATMADRKSITESILGENINYHYKFIRVGATAYHQEFDKSILPTPYIYNTYDFRGKSNDLIGTDYNIMLQPFSIFGEATRSGNGGVAYLNGAIANISNYISFSILQRNYARDFQNMYSSAYKQNTSVQNEDGVFLGLFCNPFTNLTITSTSDIYKFPWLKYRVNAPSRGNESFVQIDYILNSRTSLYLRYRNGLKQENTIAANITDIQNLQDKHTESFRFHISHKITDRIEMRNRVEYLVLTDNTTRKGFLIFQDVIYKFKRYPLDFNCRLALFDTDDYDTRIFSYENDVLYAYSMPSYYYKGTRIYVGAHCKAFGCLDFWARVSRTSYSNKNSIGTGLNQINGNTKTDVNIQVRYSF